MHQELEKNYKEKVLSRMRFKNLTGYEPYPHQIATYEALKNGKSVILRAPTGSGKSEAIFQ